MKLFTAILLSFLAVVTIDAAPGKQKFMATCLCCPPERRGRKLQSDGPGGMGENGTKRLMRSKTQNTDGAVTGGDGLRGGQNAGRPDGTGRALGNKKKRKNLFGPERTQGDQQGAGQQEGGGGGARPGMIAW
eukprot:CAMPEP_0197464982 /NCGR_PEP_ID=MMETSP1175-20131217/64307_1 /TAXON_ID=1003142 /ORGANISM="Triceratium dubium, Strain CCMP147" /LENGTH=131 /DNA_ID=CAMNT_0043000985 /DNA_START=73 /DNA_END=465 /DNA_ORIENTATION=-